jgi:putative pyruvate formate lyase activating enzyme
MTAAEARDPAYVALAESGELPRRARAAVAELAHCRHCPHECGVDRTAGQVGRCGTGRRAVVASYGPHYGEESVLVGRHGSGTVFFSHCNLGCVFCQNHDISHGGEGQAASADELALVFLRLQRMRCHNLNLVSPTHVLGPILEALALAAPLGLRLPIVWNCGGYECAHALELLDGLVDVYMPDAKYQDPDSAERLSGARGYPEVNRAALREMHRQVGVLRTDGSGVAVRGLLLRHLVLPNDLAGSGELARFVSTELSPDTFVNVMAQYRPCHMAHSYPDIARRTSTAEFLAARDGFRAAGLHRLDGE